MSKFVAICLLFLVSACNSAYKFPDAVTADDIKADYQVIYSPTAKAWSNGGMADDRIVFTKHISTGSGSYSEYTSDYQNLYLSSTYEFLFNGRLIGYSEHELKFYEVIYNKDAKFEQIELSPVQVADIFPGLEIVKTSSAKVGVITITRLPWGAKTFLLLNDGTASYYHYSFDNFYGYGTPFKSVIKVDEARDIVFSHFGADNALNPNLTISVEDSL